MDFKSSYIDSVSEDCNNDRKTITISKSGKNNINNNNNKNNNKNNNNNNFVKLSPILSITMKYGLFIEFLMVTISLIGYIVNRDWLNGKSVGDNWPINNNQSLFVTLILINGLISSWKGYKVDQKLFYSAHHFLTMCFFYCSFIYDPCLRYFIYTEIYLIMRIIKRIFDEGYINKDQWIQIYVSYSYFQTLVILIIISLMPKSIGLLDVFGCIAHIDSLITCRKVNYSGEHILKGNGNNSKWLISIDLLTNCKFIQLILSIIDVGVLWLMLIYSTGSSSGGDVIGSLNLNSYKCIIPFILIEVLIKPCFKSFKRPFCYKFSNRSSFPSGHVCVATILVAIIPSISPITRFTFVVLMAIYRIYTRAHTIEDICAAITFGQLFIGIINTF